LSAEIAPVSDPSAAASSPASFGDTAAPEIAGLRVLAIAPTPFFGDYGCHVRIVEEVTALARRGVETSIATYPFGRDLPGLRIRRAPRLLGKRNIDPGSSFRKFPMDVALAALATRIALQEHPALVHGHLHEGALIGTAIARPRGIPLVFDFQGSLTSEMLDHGFLVRGGLSYPTFRALEGWIVKRADAIVTSTHRGADMLIREFDCAASAITVVADAVDVHRFRPLWATVGEDGHLERAPHLRRQLGIPDGRPVVVYLGLLAEYQGITHLLRAAQLLVQRGVDAHFLIMGFPGEARYRQMAESLGLAEHATFTGAITYDDTPTYLSLGDVAVSPKLSQTEGNGKLLNYIAMGLPTVAFDTPVNREILGDLGVYAPYGDWTALASELEGVLRDPRAAEERGRALRASAVADHNWADSVESLVDVYRRLLKE
jgi:glycosyltransferase involved in cell wall biosynthesis